MPSKSCLHVCPCMSQGRLCCAAFNLMHRQFIRLLFTFLVHTSLLTDPQYNCCSKTKEVNIFLTLLVLICLSPHCGPDQVQVVQNTFKCFIAEEESALGFCHVLISLK